MEHLRENQSLLGTDGGQTGHHSSLWSLTKDKNYLCWSLDVIRRQCKTIWYLRRVYIFVQQKTTFLLVGFPGQPELHSWEIEPSPTSLRIRWNWPCTQFLENIVLCLPWSCSVELGDGRAGGSGSGILQQSQRCKHYDIEKYSPVFW